MLRTLREHHKKVLITLTLIIVPAFALWGGISYFQQQKVNTVAKIGNHKVSNEEFEYYRSLARVELYLMDLFSPREKRQPIPDNVYTMKAMENLLLLWKAKKDRITVSDQEVATTVQKWFSLKGVFNREWYQRILRDGDLRMDSRQFEECVRDLLRKERVIEKYIKKTDTNDDEIRMAYKKDTQQAKIAYLAIPFDKFTRDITASDQEIQDFYNSNKAQFKEEPKVKVRYIVLPPTGDLATNVVAALGKFKSIDDIKSKFNVEVKETGFLGAKDPIEGIGWQPQINQIAMTLKSKKLSAPIATKSGYLIMEKIGEKDAYIPELSEIKTRLGAQIKEQKAKEKVSGFAQDLLKQVQSKGIKNLQKIASEQKLEYKETQGFKYYDYIEGLGLDEQLSKIIFSLKKDEIYAYPVTLAKGVYIIQLKDISPVDEKDFQAKKETYKIKILNAKEYLEKIKFFGDLEKETNLVFYQ